MRTTLIILGAIALIFVIGYIATNVPANAPEATTELRDTAARNVPTTTSSNSVNATATQDTSATESTTTPNSVGTYKTYDANEIAQSDAQHILLFFHATWCPSCKALDDDIKANADKIPARVAIYKVDYDTATELKQQYGVTTQHSILEISSSGEALSPITHGATLEDVLATL
jgi:thiol-disulfide isomerase/thioredoxin